jgi:hypothetical protein
MDDVNVHYNSNKPAQFQAHAYAQGTDIHLSSGQEEHLPHEAWHVVQQKQGRVKPTMQMKGNVNVNDDAGLEKEADVMGAKALQMKSKETISRAVGNSDTQKKSNVKQGFGFVDNRPEAVAQRKLQEMADTYQETKINSFPEIVDSRQGSLPANQPVQRKISINGQPIAFDTEKFEIVKYLVLANFTVPPQMQAHEGLQNEFARNLLALPAEMKAEIDKAAKNIGTLDPDNPPSTGNLIADEAIHVFLGQKAIAQIQAKLYQKLYHFQQTHGFSETDVANSTAAFDGTLKEAQSNEDPRAVTYSSHKLGEVYSRLLLDESNHEFDSIEGLFEEIIKWMNAQELTKSEEQDSFLIGSINWRGSVENAKESANSELGELVENSGKNEDNATMVRDSIKLLNIEGNFGPLISLPAELHAKDAHQIVTSYQSVEGQLGQSLQLAYEIHSKAKELQQANPEDEGIAIHKIAAIAIAQEVLKSIEVVLEKLSLQIGLTGGIQPMNESLLKLHRIMREILGSGLMNGVIHLIQALSAQDAGRDSKQEHRYPVAGGALYYTGAQPPVEVLKSVTAIKISGDNLGLLKNLYHALASGTTASPLNNYSTAYKGMENSRNYIYIRQGKPFSEENLGVLLPQAEDAYKAIELKKNAFAPANPLEQQKLLHEIQQLYGQLQLILGVQVSLGMDLKPAAGNAAFTAGKATNAEEIYKHVKEKFPKVSPKTPQEVEFKGPAKRRDRGKGQASAMGGANAAAYSLAIAASRANKLPDLISNKPFPLSLDQVKEVGWEWLHIRGAGLGGATDASNLVTGTHAANSHMIPFEHQVKELSGYAEEDKPLHVSWTATNIAPGYAQEIGIQWAAPHGLENQEKGMFLPPVVMGNNMKTSFNPFNGQVYDKMQRDLDWQSALLVPTEPLSFLYKLLGADPGADIASLQKESKTLLYRTVMALSQASDEQAGFTLKQKLNLDDSKRDVAVNSLRHQSGAILDTLFAQLNA